MNLESRLGLGTAQFGLNYGISNRKGQTGPGEVSSILQVALKNGINLLDTASSYGNAEEVLGQNDLKDFRIVSKFMPPAHGETIFNQFQKTLHNLGVSSLYGYLAHRPLEAKKDVAQWKALKELKEKGWVRKIGFSLNSPNELEELLQDGFFPDLVQVPYNYFDRRFEKQMISLKKKGCEVHTRSVFLQGLLLVEPGQLDSFFEELRPRIQSLRDSTKFLPGALLKFVAEKDFIDTVVVGVENALHLERNIESMQLAGQLPELKGPVPEKYLMPSNWPKSKQ